MKPLHCPNPRCSNLFSPAEVQRTGVVKCPGCGQEFRFRPPSPAPTSQPIPAPAMPSPAMPKPVAVVVPVVAPSRPAREESSPKASPAVAKATFPKPAKAETAKPATAPKPLPSKPVAPVSLPPPRAVATPPPSTKPASIVRVRSSHRGNSGGSATKLAVVGAVVAIFVVAGYFLFRNVLPKLPADPEPAVVAPPVQAPPSGGGLIFEVRNQRGSPEKALTLNIDRKEWSADSEMKMKLKSLVVFKQVDAANAWFAVAVQDFGFRNPRDAELLNGAIDRLTSLFGDSLQINSSKLEKTNLCGHDAVHCAFAGRCNVAWQGECYLLSHHGFAYWIFIAAPTFDDAQSLAKLLDEQRTFAFTTDRRGWIEQPPALETFSAAELAFTIKAPDDVWQKNNPQAEDEKGVIYLAGNFQNVQTGVKDNSLAKNATLLGVAIEHHGDIREAFTDVVKYLEAKKQDESKDYRFIPVEAGANLTGEVEKVGDLKGCVGDMRLVRGDDRKLTRYVLIAVFDDGAKTFGLRFECPWEIRAVWQKEFQDILKTVRLGQK